MTDSPSDGTDLPQENPNDFGPKRPLVAELISSLRTHGHSIAFALMSTAFGASTINNMVVAQSKSEIIDGLTHKASRLHDDNRRLQAQVVGLAESNLVAKHELAMTEWSVWDGLCLSDAIQAHADSPDSSSMRVEPFLDAVHADYFPCLEEVAMDYVPLTPTYQRCVAFRAAVDPDGLDHEVVCQAQLASSLSARIN